MMDCDQAILALSARGDGELDAAGTASLDAHLAACEACRREEGALALQDASLRRAFAPGRRAAERVAASVTEAVARDGRRRVSLWALPPAMAAGFLVAVAILWRPATEVPIMPRFVALELASAPVEVRETGGSWTRMATGTWMDRACDVRSDRTPFELACGDGDRVRVDRGGEVHWAAENDMALHRGAAMVVAHEGSQLGCDVGPARVTAQGASYEGRVGPGDQWRVLVLTGRVEVVVGGQKTTLEASQVMTENGVDPDSALDPILETRWVHPLLTLATEESEELSERVHWLVARIRTTPWGQAVGVPESEIRALGTAATVSLVQCAKMPAGATTPSHAARLLADLAPNSAVGDLVGLLGHADPKVRFHAARGLERITGESLGIAANAWGACSLPEATTLQRGWVDWLQSNGTRFSSSINP